MQMPNASPQGIAGLMQKPSGQVPGQQPMPSPNKASPMAGLGSVDDRVAAYSGNTKPLEQRYAMSQDLLDLLALQKIKSQKDAAARQMQMQMAQQQAEGGEANMTVAQQREKEVGDMTKNELAEQRGDTAQQQTEQQQAMMQKMMGGIAGAPGANAAAQPKMMATGGIVGYAAGDRVEDPRRKRREGESFEDFRQRIIALDEEESRGRSQTDRVAQEAGRLAELQKRGGAAVPPSPFLGPRTDPTLAKPAAPAASPQAAIPPAEVVAAAQGAPRPPAPAPRPPAPAAAPKPPGIAGLPGAAAAASGMPAPPPVAPANDFGQKLEAAAIKNAEIDPAVRQLSEEARVEKRMALTPEQRGVYEEGIGGLQKMYQEQYDPERQQREGLKRALIGAGGRRYGEFAGAAGAGMAYDESQRAAKLKEFGDVQKARTGLIDIDRANVKEGIGAGQKAYEQGSLSQRQGMESGSRLYGADVESRNKLYGIDVESRNKALDREIDKLKISAQRDATAAAREGLSYDKARTIYATTVGRAQELERKLDDDFTKQNGMLLMQEQTGKLDPAQKNQLETAKLLLGQQKARMRKELEPVLESARQKLGVSGMSGASAEDKALVEKYAKGK